MLGERIKYLRKSKNYTQKEFSNKAGISQTYLSDIESGKKNPTSDFFLTLRALYDVSIDWLLTGKGEIYILNNNVEIIEPDKFCLSSLVKIPVFEEFIFNSEKGKFLIEMKPDSFFYLPKEWILKETKTIADSLFLYRTKGDSMSPTISNGELILVDTSRKNKKDGVFLLRINEEIYVKNIQELVGSRIKIYSENSRNLPTEIDTKITTENFEIIGQVISVMKKL